MDANKTDLFHVIHKVPAGDSPYVKAKHVQLIEKDPSRAVSMFWLAINAGDRVDSALKDMAVVLKQLNRSDEAIEAKARMQETAEVAAERTVDAKPTLNQRKKGILARDFGSEGRRQ